MERCPTLSSTQVFPLFRAQWRCRSARCLLLRAGHRSHIEHTAPWYVVSTIHRHLQASRAKAQTHLVIGRDVPVKSSASHHPVASNFREGREAIMANYMDNNEAPLRVFERNEESRLKVYADANLAYHKINQPKTPCLPHRRLVLLTSFSD